MTSNAAFAYKRTMVLVAIIVASLVFALSNARLDVWHALEPVFAWMETTPLGVIGKTWGGAFAAVQALHLLAMAVLGGAVLLGDARLLGIAFRDTPLRQVQEQCHSLFFWSLLVIIFTGVFMACGVAMKVYYLDVFWYKMLALATGVFFAYVVRRPLWEQSVEPSAGTARLVAVASLMIWFSVAATGRWIGFSG